MASDQSTLSRSASSSSTSSDGIQVGSARPKELGSPCSHVTECGSTTSTTWTLAGECCSRASESESDSDDEPLPALWWLLGERHQKRGERLLQRQQQQLAASPYGDLPQLPISYQLAKRDVRKLSCLLSKTLRHTASAWGLHIGADGYVAVCELLATPPFWELGAGLFDLMFVVKWEQRDGNKQRFAMRQGPWGPEIRATQGHSQEAVDSNSVSRIASASELPECVLHGTYLCYLSQIMADGLRPMSRHHVHMYIEEGGIGRNDAEVRVHVDVARAQAAGIEFLVAENGVVLSSGNATGVLPAKCFRKVVRIKDGAIVGPSGQFLAEQSA